jgi:hypothetical protein
MTWATDRRLDYIDWRLAEHGEIQRADLMRVFAVSEQQASIDLNAFIATHPGAMEYDKSAKRYVRAKRGRSRGKVYDGAWAIEDRRAQMEASR